MPLEPVLTEVPPPPRLNQVSNVKDAAFRAGAAPIVTYWLVPSNDSAAGVPVAIGQKSAVQLFESVQSPSVTQQFGTGGEAHAPPVHVSGAVQKIPSSQAVPSGMGGLLQRPVPVSQTSSVHAIPSLQSCGRVQGGASHCPEVWLHTRLLGQLSAFTH
jgi:hypothetical protein